MTQIFTPENRLTRILSNTTGETPSRLISDADALVEALGDTLRAYVGEKLEVIAAYAAADEDRLFAESRSLGDAARGVAEIAGAAGMETTGEIARGICGMIENLVTNGVWHTEALKVHINALKLVNQRAVGRDAGNEAILGRLSALRAAVGVLD